jgi:replicative DNA helicase
MTSSVMLAEQSVIGAILINPVCIDTVAEILTPADFGDDRHARMITAILQLHDAGTPIDVITLCDLLAEDDARYAIEIVREAPSSANAKSYAEAVKREARNRALFGVANEIANLAHEDRPIGEKIDLAQSLVMQLAQEDEIAAEDNKTALRALMETWERRMDCDGQPTGLATGWKDIDKDTLGLQPGNLIVVAARPGMGKTTFALNIAEHVALNLHRNVVVFSMEMTREELLEKTVSSVGHIPFSLIRSGGHLEDPEHSYKILPIVNRIIQSGLVIDDRGALHVQQMRAKARKLHRKSPLSLIVVDYIQLARGDGNGREQEVSSISRGLKALAKELGIPVVALSQLSRKCEERTNKRPILSDLRESGGIEQDGDIVIFLYRDEVYNENSDRKGITEVNFAKYRGGPLGTRYLASRLNISRFDDVVFNPPAVVPINKTRRGGFSA